MRPAEPEQSPEAAPATSDTAIDRLFEISSDQWAERLRRAVAPVALGSLGPYELIGEIGRGGQGEVYKALQPGTRRPIALKRIAGLGLSPDALARQRFEREVEALTRLSHPNVVTVHAVELIDRHTLLVMELVDGRPIDDWADERWSAGTGALEDILRAFAGACDGVAHAHQRGVIHRDLKPGNVLVTPEGDAKVVDFGIARVLGEHAGTTTATCALLGTLGYTAPERAGRSKNEPDTRTDIYSLGVLLFRILAGCEARSLQELAFGASPLPPPSRFRPLPRECDWIVATAAAVEPERRYQTVEDLARDIRAVLAGAAVTAAPPSTTYKLRKAIRRNRAAAIAAALITLSLLAATIVSTASARRAREALASARESEQRAKTEAARQGQVSALMREVLGASGAVAGGRPDITVREALDRAVKVRFGPGAAAPSGMDPLVESTVRAAIGDTYLGIGRYPDALIHLRAADAILSGLPHAGDAEHLRVLYLLGRCLRADGQNTDAETVLRRCIDGYRAMGQPGELPLAEALTSLGVCLRWSGRTSDAEAAYRDAMAIYERAEGPDSLGVSTASLNIAVLLSRRGDHSAAVPMARRGVEIRERAYPAAHPDKSGAYALLGNILWAAGDTSEGERYLRMAIAQDREMSPEPSAGMAGRLSDWGDRLSRIGRHDEAVALMREAFEMCASVLGPAHFESLSKSTRLSVALRRAGRAGEAEQVCLASIAMQPSASTHSSALWAELAEARIALGCADEAENALLRAWELQPSTTEADREARRALANRIAEFYETQGNGDSASRWRSIAHEG